MKRIGIITFFSLLAAAVALAQPPAPPGNQVLRVTLDSGTDKAVVTIYLTGRAVVFALPATGDMAYVSSVAAPGGKLADKADATTSISLRPGSIPGISQGIDNPAPLAPVLPKALPHKPGAQAELPGVGLLDHKGVGK